MAAKVSSASVFTAESIHFLPPAIYLELILFQYIEDPSSLSLFHYSFSTIDQEGHSLSTIILWANVPL